MPSGPDPAWPAPDEPPAGMPPEGTEHRRPGFFWRLLVVAFGVATLTMGGALIRTGEVVGIVLGLVTGAVGVAIIAVASGVVELVADRRRGPGS